MSLVLDEQVRLSSGELLLGDDRLPVNCQVTVEWLRGIAEPTWYGYFTPLIREMAVLPGPYQLHFGGDDVHILLARPGRAGTDAPFPFWGIGAPPTLPPPPPEVPSAGT